MKSSRISPFFMIVIIIQMIITSKNVSASSPTVIRFLQEDVFVENSALTDSLIKFGGGESAWGFINDDNILDLVLSGYSDSQGVTFLSIHFFNEEGKIDSIRSLSAGLIDDPLGGFGSIALGDYDNDSDLDIFVTGGALSVFFKNNSKGSFSVDFEQEDFFNFSPNLIYSTARWGDLDNDGDLDLFLMGLDIFEDRIITRIYINELDVLTFDETQILANLANGDAAWGDYDNDGDLDLVVAGQSAKTLSHVIKVYKNEPTGRLIEDTNQPLEGLKASSVSWEDYDSDGDLDLITTGWNGDTTGVSITKIYKNEPVGTLSSDPVQQISFGVSYGSIDFGDFNNDGNLDIVIAGASAVDDSAETLLTSMAQIYIGDGAGLFTIEQTIQGGMSGAFGDYDGDGDLDLFLNGYVDLASSDSTYAKVYENTGNFGSNTPPEAPGSLSSFAVGNKVIFTWNEGSDIETATSALLYNLRIGTEHMGNQILSGYVPLGNGNGGQALIKIFEDLPPGTYYWSVQAIDQGLNISGWSVEDTIFVARLVESTQSLSGVQFNTAAWNDYNNDGNLDLALTGISFALGDTATRLFKNEPLGMLTQDLRQDIRSVVGGSMAWGDYNNDGYLDFILSGFDNLIPSTYLYHWNNVSEIFDLDFSQDLPQVWGGSQNVDWSDYDNDGDLDLVLGGIDFDSQRILKVFQNDSGLLFEDTLQYVTPLWPCIVSWVDFNADGYTDLFTAGFDSFEESNLRIYLNDYTGVLVESYSQPGEGPQAGSAAWGDYDSDGLPDLAITGKYDTGDLELRIFRNFNGSSLILSNSLSGIYFGYLRWGDYDNDGDLDLVISGNSTSTEEGVGKDPISRVYRNDGNGSFAEDDSLSLQGAGTGTVLWGDYDADGDLDLLVAGIDTSEGDFSRVYDNLESIRNENLPPDSPSGLNADVNNSTVLLEWNESQDQINPEQGFTRSDAITYNLRLGYANGAHQIISGNASYGFGSRGPVERVFLRNLDDGTHYWSVQAVDNGFNRSEWSQTETFFIDTTPPEIDSLVANYGIGGQIILIITFIETFGLDNGVSPEVKVFHPEDAVPDTLLAEEQSYSGNVWTGVVTLPENYPGRAIRISIKGARDLRGNEMIPTTLYRTPAKVISSQGGIIISDDGRVTLQLSPNAVSEDVVISILRDLSFSTDSFDSTVNLIGAVYRIRPVSLTLNKPAILNILYDTSSEPIGSLSFNVDSLFTGHVSAADFSITWIGGSVDTTAQTRRITTSIDSLGYYAVFEKVGFSAGEFQKFVDLTCQPRIFSPRGSVFDRKTNIIFDLEKSEKVTVRIFNPAGRLKRTIVSGQIMNAGGNVISWDGKDDDGMVVVSGLYIVTVEAESKSAAVTVGVLNK